METNDVIAGSLDANDYGTAALAILAHPRSVLLSKLTIQRLYEFGTQGVVPDFIDVAMIEALGDLMCLEVAQ